MPKNILSKRETEITKLIIEELTSAEIAKELGISVRTVETHRRNIMKKTSSKSLISLLKFAIRKNWVEGYQSQEKMVAQ